MLTSSPLTKPAIVASERKSGSMIACVMVNVASQSVICSQATRAVITFVIEAG